MAKQRQKKQRQTPRSRASAAQVLLNLQASGFVVTFLVLIVAGVVILSPTLRVLAEQQQEIAGLEAALAESEQQVVALEEQRERWKDPAFVETQARERLLFVYPGDITYLVIDDGEGNEDDAGIEISTEIVGASTDWRESLLAS
ncbi:MAG TPA: septum formation initiator family protein, partial [Pontimonas sp.]|nr:septum formation initiator family protein [Pontimonas sp.]